MSFLTFVILQIIVNIVTIWAFTPALLQQIDTRNKIENKLLSNKTLIQAAIGRYASAVVPLSPNYDIIQSNNNKVTKQDVLYVQNHANTADINDIVKLFSNNKSLAEKFGYTDCADLDLESPACEADCNIYLNLDVLIGLIVDEEYTTLLPYVEWAIMSGKTIGYQYGGNIDMCEYLYGTYCYVPAYFDIYVVSEQGCCVPGNCTGKLHIFLTVLLCKLFSFFVFFLKVVYPCASFFGFFLKGIYPGTCIKGI